MKKPNIVLLTIDSLRSDFVGFQNPHEKNTPFLDKLAQKSMVFKNAIAPGVPTQFCFPSLMTGRPPFFKGYYLGIPKGTKTLAQVLQENGYQTLAFVADNPMLYKIYGYDSGFDYYFDYYSQTEFSNFESWLLKTGRILRDKLGNKPANEMWRIIYFFNGFVQFFANNPKISTPAETINKDLKRHLKKEIKPPFFLWLHYMDVHTPYYSGITDHFKFSNKIKEKLAKLIFYCTIKHKILTNKIKNKITLNIIKKAYRDSIKYTDKRVEQIYSFIKKNYPNTIFIITSDHGEQFMEHQEFQHQPSNLYQELIEVPLLINFPSAKKTIINKTISLISIPKTICSVVKIKEASFKGTNLLNTARESHLNKETKTLYKFKMDIKKPILDNKTKIKGYCKLTSIIKGKYKYIKINGKQKEVYNLKKDPKEKNNLSAVFFQS